MQKTKEIQRLTLMGMSDRAIARALKVNRRTVQKYKEALDPSHTAPAPQAITQDWYDRVDWDVIGSEVRKGVPVLVLWEELRDQGQLNVQYPAFWKQLRRRVPNIEATMVRVFAPGDRAEIDYADGIEILDPFTGEFIKTQLFVGVLCHSRFVYAEFSLSQKSADFLGSHIRMFEAFGGVPRVVSPDNLKSAVVKAHRYDPEINPAYTKLCEHYDTAVVPARVRKPKDKAIVERSIQIFQRWFFFKYRRHTFTCLAELNALLKKDLAIFNDREHRIFRKTRSAMLETERPHLKPLPAQRFEVATHATAKVHHDCHVVFEGSFYSADHTLRGLEVDIWATAKAVEIYYQNQRVAFHRRANHPGTFITDKKHYPPSHLAYAETTPKYLRDKASKIGPYTSKLIHQLLSGDAPLKYLRRAQGIIRLEAKHGREALEQAAAQALALDQLSFRTIQRLILNPGLASIRPASKAIQRGSNPHLRGNSLFH